MINSKMLNSGHSSLYPDMDNHLIPHDIQLDFIKDHAAVATFDCCLVQIYRNCRINSYTSTGDHH